MVKCGRRPVLVDMAIRALGDRHAILVLRSVFRCELARVHVFVAGFAFLGRALELNFLRSGQHFMAFAAGNAAMGSE